MRTRRWLLACVLLVAGCSIDFRSIFGLDPVDRPEETGKAGLVRFESEAELKAYIDEQADYVQRGYFTGGGIAIDEDSAGGLDAPTAPPAPGAVDSGNQGVAGDGEGSSNTPVYSETTEQEEGVQEGDVLKTDGEFIYILSRDVLRIVRANPASALSEVASVQLEGYARDLYLLGDRAVALSEPAFEDIKPAPGAEDGSVRSAQLFYQPRTDITVVNLADRENPVVLSRSRLDGSVQTSRMIEDRLYLVVVNYPDYSVNSGQDVPVDNILPKVEVEVSGENPVVGNLANATDHYRPLDPDGLGFTTVVSLDVDNPLNYQARTVVALPANVYSSTQALYLTDSQYKFDGTTRESTDIYKFEFTDAGTELVAVGSAPGRVLNQYSMSEHNGHLRLATTVSRELDDFRFESVNNVYVLAQVGGELQETGRIEDLAPGETIFSARFAGDRGYLVTFEQIDPLFTLDLSDPTDPRVVGELKVPGFSTFIVPMGENHLLTIGQHTDEEFGFTFSQGVRLSIFDVTDFADPQLAYFEVIGTNGGYSEALYNPKAFTYFAERDLVAFPMEIYDYGDFGRGFGGMEPLPVDIVDDGGNSAGGGVSSSEAPVMAQVSEPSNGDADEPPPDSIDPISAPIDLLDSFVGLYVYRATAEGGFELLGRISTRPEGEDYYFGPMFSRAVFIEDMVYAVTSDNVQVVSVSDVSTPVAKVQFPIPEVVFPDGPIVGPPALTPEPAPVDAAAGGGTSGSPGVAAE